uniref:Ribosomal RNA small subunit methyltransferase Nep1 n=1 Tax=Geoglobus ahangari TaxID=113653 RepID=A0A7C3UHT5_9EURY
MVRFVFIDSALETIPKVISSHPVILKEAKRRKKKPEEIILDDSKHYKAMRLLKDREKRGRPDIIHACLLALLDSQIKDLEIYIHTYDNKVIWINRETKIPRNYNRFVGLMEDLFKKKVITSNDRKLLEITDLGLEDVLKEKILVMKEGSRWIKPEDVADCSTICIGGFQHGDFSKQAYDVFKRKKAEFVGLGEKPLTSLYVTYKIVCMIEGFFN